MHDKQGMPHRWAKCHYSTHNFARYKLHLSIHYQDIEGYSYRRPSIFLPQKTARIPLEAKRSEKNDPRNIRYSCDQCNYSCSAKHNLTKHINSCHTVTKSLSSPVKKCPTKPPGFPLPLFDLPQKKHPSPEQKKNQTNPIKLRLSSSSSSSLSNNSEAERLIDFASLDLDVFRQLYI